MQSEKLSKGKFYHFFMIILDFLNNDNPYCESLGNLYEIDLSHNNDIFLKNRYYKSSDIKNMTNNIYY